MKKMLIALTALTVATAVQAVNIEQIIHTTWYSPTRLGARVPRLSLYLSLQRAIDGAKSLKDVEKKLLLDAIEDTKKEHTDLQAVMVLPSLMKKANIDFDEHYLPYLISFKLFDQIVGKECAKKYTEWSEKLDSTFQDAKIQLDKPKK